jgi:hypothetical protein
MVEAIISTYHLQGNTNMWWDQLMQDKNLDEKKVSWRQFKGYFQEKYLSKNYYERKMKDFFELKLGSMEMDEYEKIVRQHRYSNRGRTPSVTTHITRSKINTPMFSHGKTPTGKHPRPQPTRPLGAVY